jgi:hypothetical protein
MADTVIAADTDTDTAAEAMQAEAMRAADAVTPVAHADMPAAERMAIVAADAATAVAVASTVAVVAASTVAAAGTAAVADTGNSRSAI